VGSAKSVMKKRAGRYGERGERGEPVFSQVKLSQREKEEGNVMTACDWADQFVSWAV